MDEMKVTAGAGRQALGASHEQRLSRQRALIDELFQETEEVVTLWKQ